MTVISLLIFFLIIIFGLTSEAFRQISSIKLDGLLILKMNYAIIYGLCPLYILYTDNPISDQIYLFGITADPVTTVKIALAGASAFFFSYMAYRIGSNFRLLNDIALDETQIYRATAIGLIFVFIAVNIYVYQYGGFYNTVIMSGYIRQGFQDNVLTGSGELLFFQSFTPLAFVITPATLILFQKNRNFKNLTLFIASIVITISTWLILGSRGHIVISIIIVFFSYITFKYNGTKKINSISFITLIFILFLLDYFIGIGKSLSSALYREDLTLYDVFDTFKYIPFVSIVAYYDEFIASAIVSFSVDSSNYTYYYDSLIAPAYLIPSRLFNIIKPESIMVLNTYNVIGVWESVIPPGLIGYGYYSLGPIGVLISAFIYGFFLGVLDKSNMTSQENRFANSLIITPFILYWGIYFFQGDPKTLIGTLTAPMMFLLLMRIFRKAPV